MDNGSKHCLLHLADHLRARGSLWMDIQQLTPHLETLGAREIPRAEFLSRLRDEQAAGRMLFPSRAT
jgi:leucyl/phenylalanyl-tRNA--protein transferase